MRTAGRESQQIIEFLLPPPRCENSGTTHNAITNARPNHDTRHFPPIRFSRRPALRRPLPRAGMDPIPRPQRKRPLRDGHSRQVDRLRLRLEDQTAGRRPQIIWNERVSSDTFGSPVCAGDKIFCIDKNGVVTVIAPTGQLVKLAENDLDELCHTTPAVSGGVMFARTYEHLIAIR